MLSQVFHPLKENKCNTFNDKDACVSSWGASEKYGWSIRDKVDVPYALLPVKKGKNEKRYTVMSCAIIKKSIM